VYLFGVVGILFLALTAVFGFSVLRALKLPLKEIELMVAAPIVGTIAAAWLCLIPAVLAESLDAGIIVSSLIMLGTIVWVRPGLPRPEKDLILAVAIITFVSFIFMYFGLFTYFDGQYHAAFPFYGDAAFHAAMMNSFSQGSNFPPQYPMMAGQPLRYTFLIDLFSGMLDRLGLGLQWSIVLPGWLLLSGLLTLLYSLGVRFTGRLGGGAIAVTLTVLSGGLGFLWAIGDWRSSGLGILAFLSSNNLNYTCMYNLNLVFTNFIIIVMAQRTALIGFAAGIFIIVLVYAMLVQREFDDLATRNGLALAGVMTGLLPLFHVYSYICALLSTGLLLLIFREKKWYWFIGPAMLLAIPQALWISEQMGASYFRVQIGWMAGSILNIPLFWVENLGLSLFLLIAGFFLISRKNLLFYLPFLGIFVMANLFVFQPWDYDNHKFFSFWFMPSALLMASALLFVYDRPKLGKPLFTLLLTITVLTGVLVAIFIIAHPYGEINSADIHVGEWIIDNTPKDAVFLTSDSPISPVTTVAGRKSYLGYGGWLYTHGIDFSGRENNRIMMYDAADTSQTLEMLKDDGINYVLVGPSEMSSSDYKVNTAFFDNNLLQIYNWTDPVYDNNYRIYQV